jgi:hypothetical protein
LDVNFTALFLEHDWWVRDKILPVTGRGGSHICGTPRIPLFLDNRLTDGCEVVILTRPPPAVYPNQIPVTQAVEHFPNAAERIRSIEKSNYLMENRNCDLSVCSIVKWTGNYFKGGGNLTWGTCLCGVHPVALLKKNLHGLSPRATAACRRSYCQVLLIESATSSAWRIPTAVFSVF